MNLVYRAIWRNDNHWRQTLPDPEPRLTGYSARALRAPRVRAAGGVPTKKSPGLGAVAAQDNAVRKFGISAPGAIGTGRERGRRRTRQDQISTGALGPSEIADLKIRTERRKLVFFCRTGFSKSKLPEMTIQPFDLMSRRHPLSSTRAADWNLLQESKSSRRLV